MTEDAFDPRHAAELIDGGYFTADELAPLLEALPRGVTLANHVDRYGFQSYVVLLSGGQKVAFEAQDVSGTLRWRFYMLDGATEWATADDAWGKWVAVARKQYAALGAVLAAVGGAQ